MKHIGIIRSVDALGRIVLPAELRQQMDIRPGDALEILVEDDCVVLQKFAPSCLFCGSKEELLSYREKLICRDCARRIGRAME